MVVSNTYCVVFLFFFILCTPHAASGLSFCFSSSCVPPMLPVSLDCRFVCLHLVYPLCCQFIWIVVLFVFILCTSYVASFSGLSFCLSSSCVPPMLPVSLDSRFVCLHLVYLLCCQILWIVILFFFILCTPYVASFSGLSFCFSSSCVPLCCQFLWIVVLFFFILCTPYVASGLSFCFSSSCVPHMLPVSLDCRFVCLHLVYPLCCQFLWIVVLFVFILCTSYVASFSGLSFCLSSSCVPPMLPVSLDCRFVCLHLVYPLCCLWIVVLFFFILCTPYVASFSGFSFCFSSSCESSILPVDCRLFFFILCTPYVASGLSFCFSSSCVPPMLPLDCRFVFLHLLYLLCCQFLWIVVLFFFILCTPYVASFCGLSFCFSSSYVPLCCLWIVVLIFFILCTPPPPPPYVASFSGLSFCFSSSCVPPMLPLDYRFVFLHLVYLLCCQFLWIVVLFFFILCTPYVASGLSFCLSSSCVPTMLPVSLDCRFVFRHLVYLLCCQFLWIVVLFFFILCTPYVASFCGLSFCFSLFYVPLCCLWIVVLIFFILCTPPPLCCQFLWIIVLFFFILCTPMLPLDCRFVFLHLVYLLCFQFLWIVVLFFFILCTSLCCLWIIVLFFFILCTSLCCLWIIVLFFFILCTPYVSSFSGLSFCFSSSCVPPMLPLDCRFVFLHLVYPLCCLWIVVLFFFILCTPYVASGLSFCFSSSCVPPMLPLDCRFVFLHPVYPLCCQFLWIVVLFFFILCTLYVASFSGLSFCFSSSCVPPIYVASFSGFSFCFSSSCVPSMLPVSLDCRFVFLHLVYPLCCQFLWIVVLFFFILCTSYVASFSGLSFCFSSSCVPPMLPLDCRFVFLHLVYPLCCQFLWIVVLFFFILCTLYVASFSGLSFCFSSSCVPPIYVASFSGFSFCFSSSCVPLMLPLDYRFVFRHLVYLLCCQFLWIVVCFSSSCVPPMLPVSLDCRFVFLHLVYPLCCQFLWIFVLFFFILCTPYVASGLSFCFSSSCVPPMLPVSLDCRFVFLHLVYPLCCLWIFVLFFFILCTPYVASFSGLSFCFSSSCVPSMLPVSLDCRFVFLHLVYPLFMLPVSLDFRFVFLHLVYPLCCQFLWIVVLFFFILCTPYLCCQFLWIVVLFFFILCTPYVASFSGLSFCFSSSCVPPMLPVSLDCRFVFLHLVYPLCCLWIVVLFFFILCTLYVASFSGLSFCFSSSCVPPMLPLDCRFVCLHLVYPLCCQFLWIAVLFFFILCTPYVASGLSFSLSSSCEPPMLPLDFRFVFLHLVYLLCCQFLWIAVLFFFILCTSYVARFSGLSFLFFFILCTSYVARFSGLSFLFFFI